jgi:hypothetical protein
VFVIFEEFTVNVDWTGKVTFEGMEEDVGGSKRLCAVWFVGKNVYDLV